MMPMQGQLPDLGALADKYGSDKGYRNRDAHGYTAVYDLLLAHRRAEPLNFLEIGLLVGGPEATGGSARRETVDAPSIRMWLDYLPNARIFGFDISDFSAVSLDRFTFVQGDMGEPVDLARLRAACPDGFDVVVDDGSHASWHQQTAFIGLFPALVPGGTYIIEDLHWQPAQIEELKSVPKTAELFSRFLLEGRFAETGDIPEERYLEAASQIAGVTFINEAGLPSGPAKMVIIRKKAGEDLQPSRSYHRSRVFQRLGKAEEAAEWARKAETEDPSHFDAAHEHARLAFSLEGPSSTAVDLARGLVERFPDNDRGLALGAWVLSRLPEHLAEGVSLQQRAVERAPGVAGYRVTLAHLLRRSGEHDLARSVLEETLELFPDNELARQRLAELTAKDGM